MYGIVGVGERRARSSRSPQMVEKPKREKAPSNLIITGRYILQPEIFDLLATAERGAGGEIQLTDAMMALAKHAGRSTAAVRWRELRLRIEDRLPQANVAYALDRPVPRAGAARGDQAADGKFLIRHPEVAARSAALEGRRPKPQLGYPVCIHPSRLAALAPQGDGASCGAAIFAHASSFSRGISASELCQFTLTPT